jgi:PEP-CTERM motif-containing protein/uncharacterized protein DUF4114
MRLSTISAAGSLALAATLLATPLAAAPILGTGGSGLHTLGPAQENSAKYWDGNSWDSNSSPDGAGWNPCNAGSLASGVGCGLNTIADDVARRAGLTPGTPFYMANTDGGFQAWENADGTADMNFGFGNQGATYDFTMLGEFTDDWDVNEVGWYEVGNPLNRHTIFGANAAVGSTSQVWIPSNFGFYYLNTNNGKMFFTDSSQNTQGHNQQFAAFQYNDYTLLGVEDIFSNTKTRTWTPGGADYDYNDVMFGFRAASVPEPGTLLLVGMGLAGLAATRRRAVR